MTARHDFHWAVRRTSMKGVKDWAWPDQRASQLVEFAVALPLLVVFVVGIFDFSNAFTLKQRLTNIARDAARASAYDPSSDVPLSASSPVPMSVLDAFQVIDNYLLASRLNDCGITSSGTSSGLTWTFTANGNGCPTAGLTIIVNRGYFYPPNSTTAPGATCQPQSSGGQVALISTCVSIQYPYAWRFGNAASLLGAQTALPPQITAVAVAFNEN
jgi:Flp pilus assembly protein TadG